MRWVAWFAVAGCTGQEVGIRQLFPSIAVVPEEVAFGDVGPPLTESVTVFVSNTGGADLDLVARLEGPPVFTVSVPEDALAGDDGSWSFTVGPGEQASLPVTFAPDAFRAFEGQLLLESNDLELPRVAVPISGRGVDLPFPDIEIAPARTVAVSEVPIGQTELLAFDVRNVGDAPLTLTGITLVGDATFAPQSVPTGAVIQPGDQRTAIFGYTPVDELGDNTFVILESDDPDEASLSVLLLGNGGGPDFEYPEAVIDCPTQVLLTGPEFVALDGSGSFDPAGLLPLTYEWTVTQRPEGSDVDIPLDPDDTPAVDLYADVAGQWSVQLVVANAVGTRSEPTTCTFGAIPEDAIHVELSWDTPASDVDLHLVQGGSTVFDIPEDCHFENVNPNWGTNAPEDDPRLDIDDLGGFGPENINIEAPAAGTYGVYVHYFNPKQDGASVATVKVWLYGVEVFSGSRVLEDKADLWAVGTITVPAGTFAADPAPNTNFPVP